MSTPKLTLKEFKANQELTLVFWGQSSTSLLMEPHFMELMRAMQWSTHGKTLFITTLKGITEAYHQTLEVLWHHTAQ